MRARSLRAQDLPQRQEALHGLPSRLLPDVDASEARSRLCRARSVRADGMAMKERPKTCLVSGCTDQVKHRCYCERHYCKWRRYGSPSAGKTYAKRGEGTFNRDGYKLITSDGSQRMEHVVIAERALGRRLPKGAQVHHVNENKSDNRNANLVICPNDAYHQLLHRRTRALDECGHADWRKCNYCLTWDDPAAMRIRGRSAHHPACRRVYQQQYRRRVSPAKRPT